MQMSDLRPAGALALNYGVKSLVYGGPGSGKTPLMNTAPRPLLLVCEPGMLSMRNSTVPCWLGNSPALIDDFFAWLKGSNEARNFDTVGIDSGSEMANIYLEVELGRFTKQGNKPDGKAAYGNMARAVMGHLRTLFFMQYKHAYVICQQGIIDVGGTQRFIPGFPGRALEKDVPHLYDEILHLGIHNVPGYGMIKSFQTAGSFDITARDRSGKLAEYEPCDLAALFAKAMS